MGLSISQVLAPKTVVKAVNQLNLPGTTLQRLFGWHFSGTNKMQQSGRNFSYDVVESTRRIATGRNAGAASSRQQPQAVATVNGTFPRAAETISLLDEDLLNRRRIGGPSDDLDARGETFVTRQEAYLAQRFANLIEFQTAAMLRGVYSYLEDGDDLRHGFSGGLVDVDFQIPAGNKDQLNMLGGGNILAADWATTSTDIPKHLHQINAALVQLTGLGLAHVVLTSVGWQYLVNNTKVQAQGGSANVVFDSLERKGAGEFSVVLRAMPWITFHVIDYGLDIWNGSTEVFTKLIPDTHAAFFPEPSRRWTQFLEGSEIVTDGPNGAKSEQFGFHPFAYPVHDPSGWNLSAVFNGIPALYLPAAVAYGKITGGSY